MLEAKLQNDKMLEQMNSKQFDETKEIKQEKITEIKKATAHILKKQNTVPIPQFEPKFLTMGGGGKLGKKKMNEI